MAFYNRDEKKLKLKGKKRKFIGNGMCGEVYLYDEFVLKKYFEDTSMFSRLKAKEFDILKDIDSPNFIKLYEIYQKLTIRELEIYNDTKLGFSVDAYTSRYYKGDNTNTLTKPVEYLLQNIRELDKLFDTFSDNSIIVADMKYGNVIINENHIILVDPDTFNYVGDTYNIDTLKELNKEQLINLIKSILTCQVTSVEEISDWKKVRGIEDNIEKEISNISIEDDPDIAYKFSKKLRNVKRPIDYFYRDN